MTSKNPCYPWKNEETQAAFSTLIRLPDTQKRFLETVKTEEDAKFIVSRTMDISLFEATKSFISFQQLADHANHVMHRG